MLLIKFEKCCHIDNFSLALIFYHYLCLFFFDWCKCEHCLYFLLVCVGFEVRLPFSVDFVGKILSNIYNFFSLFCYFVFIFNLDFVNIEVSCEFVL